MYGWRARLGVLVPSGIVAIEPEFNRMAPEGVCCHYHRFNFTDKGHRDDEQIKYLKMAEEYIGDASELITHIDPTIVVMCGTGVSFVGGVGYDQKLIEKMRERNGGLPTTTTSTSVIDAFRKMNIKKVSVVMPYLEELSKITIKFVEDSGVKVIDAKWLSITGLNIAAVSDETLYHLAKEVDDPKSDAIFISCVNLHTIGVIEKLECDLHKPIITSNQATMWNILRMAGINDIITGYGRLLSQH